MATKPLPSQEALRQLLDYDPETGVLTWRARGIEWFTATTEKRRRAIWKLWNDRYPGEIALNHVDAYGYLTGAILGRTWKAHRAIWVMEYGSLPTQIDHINGDRTDNRISNLRNVSPLENARNVRRTSRNLSGVVGVKWDKRSFVWIAEIKIRGKAKQIGRFDLFWDAVAARKSAEKEFGFHENHGRE